MIITWWRRWRRDGDRPETPPPADWMLRRTDDKWLDDIGLTRDELRRLLNRWDE